MDTSRGIIFLTGADGVRRDATRRISRIRYDAGRGLYLINFEGSEKLFYYRKSNVQVIRSAGTANKSRSVMAKMLFTAKLLIITNY